MERKTGFLRTGDSNSNNTKTPSAEMLHHKNLTTSQEPISKKTVTSPLFLKTATQLNGLLQENTKTDPKIEASLLSSSQPTTECQTHNRLNGSEDNLPILSQETSETSESDQNSPFADEENFRTDINFDPALILEIQKHLLAKFVQKMTQGERSKEEVIAILTEIVEFGERASVGLFL